VDGIIAAQTVTVTVPWDTTLTDLTPDNITISPRAAIDPASGEPQDFSNPVTYTVTAENGSKVEWTVTVQLAPSPMAKITAFTVAGEAGTINSDAQTVTVTVPWGTVLTGVTPGIAISDKAGISPKPEDPQDFLTAEGFNPVTYTVTAEDGSPAFWTVTVKWAPLASGSITADITDYLSNAGGGTDSDDLVPLPVSGVNLTDGTNWADLLTGIQTGNKFVALDLSACTMNGTEFDPTGGSSGKAQIVSLVLPNDAETIKPGTSSDFAFKNFSALKSVTGNGITTVSQYVFDANPFTALQTVSFPNATTINTAAFEGCIMLAEVYLPKVTKIGLNAFHYCVDLKTVDLSSVETIGGSAFQDCTSLAGISLPNATTIGSSAFYHCTGLATLDLSSATEIETNAFSDTGAQELTVTLGQTVPTLGITLFSSVIEAKTVTIQVPSNATGYASALPAEYKDTENTMGGPYWGEGFRGLGWESDNYTSADHSSDLNTSVTVNITNQQ
jgi:hypothetical protein